jgi:hypothetical protein
MLNSTEYVIRIVLQTAVGLGYFIVLILGIWGVVAHCQARVKKLKDLLKPTLFVTLGSSLIATGSSGSRENLFLRVQGDYHRLRSISQWIPLLLILI